MEAVTVIGVAAAALQFFDFSSKILSKCRELRDHNDLLPDLVDLDKSSRRLQAFAGELSGGKITSQSSRQIAAQSAEASELCRQLDIHEKKTRELGRRLSKTAEELSDLVADINKKARLGPQPLRVALRAVRQQRKIEKFEKLIEKEQHEFETIALSGIKSRVDLNSLEQTASFENIRQSLFILTESINLQNEETSQLHRGTRTDINQHIDDSCENVRSGISKELRDSETSSRLRRRRELLLEELFVPGGSARREAIEPAWRSTFEWAFDDYFKVRPDDSTWVRLGFYKWLSEEDALYWIKGLPGTGKSTLMAFLADHSKTREGLDRWSGGKTCQVLSHFFWRPGTIFQKNMRGLLRTLLYQVCKTSTERTDFLAQHLRISEESLNEWSEKTLQRCLLTCLQQTETMYCIFVDGLDEFDGDIDILLDLLKELNNFKNIKCCVSSRPEAIFESRLGNSSLAMRLQDLTYSDIHALVSGKLECCSWPVDFQRSHGWFSTRIASSSAGVFLWAKIAVRSVLSGVRHGDDERTLISRLEDLPTELDSLYQQLLASVDEHHKKNVAFYIQAMQLKKLDIDGAGASVALIAAAQNPDNIEPLDSFVQKCEQMEDRIKFQSRNLIFANSSKPNDMLEITPKTLEDGLLLIFDERVEADRTRTDPAPISEIPEDYNRRCSAWNLCNYENSQLQYMHHTVFDFLSDTDSGKAFMKEYSKPQGDLVRLLTRAQLKLANIGPHVCENKLSYQLLQLEEFGGRACSEVRLEDRNMTLDNISKRVATMYEQDKLTSTSCFDDAGRQELMHCPQLGRLYQSFFYPTEVLLASAISLLVPVIYENKEQPSAKLLYFPHYVGDIWPYIETHIQIARNDKLGLARELLLALTTLKELVRPLHFFDYEYVDDAPLQSAYQFSSQPLDYLLQRCVQRTFLKLIDGIRSRFKDFGEIEHPDGKIGGLWYNRSDRHVISVTCDSDLDLSVGKRKRIVLFVASKIFDRLAVLSTGMYLPSTEINPDWVREGGGYKPRDAKFKGFVDYQWIHLQGMRLMLCCLAEIFLICRLEKRREEGQSISQADERWPPTLIKFYRRKKRLDTCRYETYDVQDLIGCPSNEDKKNI